LPVVDAFTDSFGEDGTIFGLPDPSVEMEIVRADAARVPDAAFDQLVFYLDNAAAVATATAPLRDRGLQPRPDAHPYWQARGAVTFRDPDGRDVVFAPWVYGRDPEPGSPGTDSGVHIELYDGPREELRSLFELAEDSAAALASYFHEGRVLVAREQHQIVGHLQLVDTGSDGVVELKSMAVRTDRQGRGIGAALVQAAVTLTAGESMSMMVVSTAAESTGNLRFYQRQGFRLRSVDRDAFTPATGYADGVLIDGIPLRDRVWLDRPLATL
jgi:GNAT superfamily N-acetyltransferase